MITADEASELSRVGQAHGAEAWFTEYAEPAIRIAAADGRNTCRVVKGPFFTSRAGYIESLGFDVEAKREPGDGPHRPGYDYFLVSW